MTHSILDDLLPTPTFNMTDLANLPRLWADTYHALSEAKPVQVKILGALLALDLDNDEIAQHLAAARFNANEINVYLNCIRHMRLHPETWQDGLPYPPAA